MKIKANHNQKQTEEQIDHYSELLALGGQMRIARRIAMAGIASRRKAEELLEKNRVYFADSGEPITDPATRVQSYDTIRVDRHVLRGIPRLKIWRYYKPKGSLTTRKDPKGRKTIFDSLPENLKGAIAVGRLDFTSEGLLLLTNNGALSRLLEHPDQEIPRSYEVEIHGHLKLSAMQALRDGVVIDGVVYRGIAIERVKKKEKNWLHITLWEGKNREIRRMMDYCGCKVSKLVRTSYGKVNIRNLKAGEVLPLSDIHVVRILQDIHARKTQIQSE